MSDLRFGLIGTGRHGVRYANHLLRGDIPGATLAAIHRRDHAAGMKQAGEWGVTCRESAEELAGDPAVDAVLVVSPARHHGEAALATIAAGKPALIEKPLAADLAGCDEIERAASGAGARVMVAQTTRYEGPVLGLFEALPRIGAVRQVSFVLRSEDRTHDESGVFQPRLDDGGAVLDSGVHYFDLLPRLVGAVEAVLCEEMRVRGTELSDAYSAILRCASGAVVTVSMGRWGNSRHEFVEVSGEEGLILLSRTPASLSLVTGREIHPLPFPDVAGTLVPTLLDFVRVCRGEIDPPITIADGRSAVAIAEACCHSGGSWVSLPG